MARQPEYEDDDAQSGVRASDSQDAVASATRSKADLVRLKLKLISSYVIDGFAPFVAVIALIVAVVAVNGNKSDRAQLSQSAAKMDSLNANLLASRAELEKLKIAFAQQKSLHEGESNKQEERAMQIVQSVSKLQVKMKISPTLEEQLLQPASTAAVTPAVANAASAPAVAVPVPATAAVSTVADKKPGAQVQILKEAINKFNKK